MCTSDAVRVGIPTHALYSELATSSLRLDIGWLETYILAFYLSLL